MKTYLECVPCIIKQVINTLKISGCSNELGRKVISEVLHKLKNIDYRRSPAANSDIAYTVFKEVTGIKDPYYDLKRKYNRLALDIYPELKKVVDSAKDKLYTAAKIAVAGNVIDFGIDIKKADTLDLSMIIRDLKSTQLAVDDFDKFRESLKNSINILYITDNSGEIVFDKIFIKELDGLAGVIETGNGNIGINMDNSSDAFLKEFKKADLIISKGQGNFETLDKDETNIFFLLKAKCEYIAKELGVRYLDIVFTGSKTRSGKAVK